MGLKGVFSGWLLFLGLILSLVAGFTHWIPGYYAGIPIWIASFLFFPDVRPAQKKQIIVLLALGGTGLFYGAFHGIEHQFFIRALAANQVVVYMLIAVGFLRLFAVDEMRQQERLPQGKWAIIRTLFGAHLFGAVLNMSSVVIVGDKLASKGKLVPTQGLMLLRAFSICAFWSPFFAAMGLTLVSAPGAQLSTLVLFGIPVSIVALLLSAWQLAKRPDVEQLLGYPITLYSLWMPALLAMIVMASHHFWPKISVLSLVSLISLAFIGLWMSITQGRIGIRKIRHHIDGGIASSRGEVVLFSAAALLASGVAALLSSLNIDLAPADFGAFEAGMTVIALVVLAMTGMHPVTSVVLAGSILSPNASDPDLLGLALLMGWSLGITLSPFSGIQLSIQSRYAISAKTLLALNWRYILAMLVVCLLMLWLYTCV